MKLKLIEIKNLMGEIICGCGGVCEIIEQIAGFLVVEVEQLTHSHTDVNVRSRFRLHYYCLSDGFGYSYMVFVILIL